MKHKENIKALSMPSEEWKGVVGYEDLYMVSSFGRVFSIRNSIILKPFILTSNGYYAVSICRDGKRNSRTVHRLLVDAFLPNPNNYPEIDHIDGDKHNNTLSNLRRCDGKMNMNNPVAKKRISDSMKAKCNKTCSIAVCQLKDGEVVNTYPSIMEAERSGFCSGCITKCCKNISSYHKGFQWMFLSDYETLTNKSKTDYLSK